MHKDTKWFKIQIIENGMGMSRFCEKLIFYEDFIGRNSTLIIIEYKNLKDLPMENN